MKPPVARQLIADWISRAWKSISADTLWNSWRHSPFSYFPDKPTCCIIYKSDYSFSEDDEEANDGEDTLEAVGV